MDAISVVYPRTFFRHFPDLFSTLFNGRFTAKLQFVFNFQFIKRCCKKCLDLFFLLHRENTSFDHCITVHTIYFAPLKLLKRTFYKYDQYYRKMLVMSYVHTWWPYVSVIVLKCIVNEAEQCWFLKKEKTSEQMTKAKRLNFYNGVKGSFRWSLNHVCIHITLWKT